MNDFDPFSLEFDAPVSSSDAGFKIIDYSELTPELAAQGVAVLNMPNDAYHAYAGISNSGLSLVDRSPAHYKHRKQSEPTRAMVIGSAAHAAILEPEQFDRQYFLLSDGSDRRSSIYKDAVKTYGEENVLNGTEAESVSGMQSALQLNAYAKHLLDLPGWCEIAFFATDPKTGALVKCKFDKLTANLLSVDLKTTQDIREFVKSVANYRYHVQQAFYSDVFFWATGKKLSGFEFLAVEKEFPHASRVFVLDNPAIDYGRKLYREALDAYAKCLAKNEWPMPDGGIEFIGLPSWASDPEQFEEY